MPGSIRHSLKIIRWQTRRSRAAFRWGKKVLDSAPAVLGNAMPKSGSHLVNQVLQGLTKIGPYVNPGFPPVNRTEDNERLPEAEILSTIQRMQPGDIAYGYILAKEPFVTALTAPGRATIFVYRDPRDMIISHIFYATQMYEGHWMHQYYTEKLHTMEERINAAIEGVQEPGSELTPVRQRYAGYIGWLDQPAVLSLRFEDLILDRDTAFNRLLDYLELRSEVIIRSAITNSSFGGSLPLGSTLPPPITARTQAVETLKLAITPKKSGTFRKGKPGNWREYFTEANKNLFKESAGDLLIQLGYETDNNW